MASKRVKSNLNRVYICKNGHTAGHEEAVKSTFSNFACPKCLLPLKLKF